MYPVISATPPATLPATPPVVLAPIKQYMFSFDMAPIARFGYWQAPRLFFFAFFSNFIATATPLNTQKLYKFAATLRTK